MGSKWCTGIQDGHFALEPSKQYCWVKVGARHIIDRFYRSQSFLEGLSSEIRFSIDSLFKTQQQKSVRERLQKDWMISTYPRLHQKVWVVWFFAQWSPLHDRTGRILGKSVFGSPSAKTWKRSAWNLFFTYVNACHSLYWWLFVHFLHRQIKWFSTIKPFHTDPSAYSVNFSCDSKHIWKVTKKVQYNKNPSQLTSTF